MRGEASSVLCGFSAAAPCDVMLSPSIARAIFLTLRIAALAVIFVVLCGVAICGCSRSFEAARQRDVQTSAAEASHAETSSSSSTTAQAERHVDEQRHAETTRTAAPTTVDTAKLTLTPVAVKLSDGREVIAFKRERTRTKARRGLVQTTSKVDEQRKADELAHLQRLAAAQAEADRRAVAAAAERDREKTATRTSILPWWLVPLLGAGAVAALVIFRPWRFLPWT